MSDMESGFSLADVTGLLRRRSAIVLAGAILGLLAGYLVFASAEPKYSATARVEVVTTSGPDAQSTPGGQRIDIVTESEKVKSDEVGNQVRKELSLAGDNRTLFSGLTVTAKEDSRILGLTYETGDATKTRDIANAIGRAYLNVQSQAAERTRSAKTEELNQQLAEAQAALNDANEALDATETGSSGRIAAQTEVQRATQTVTTLSTELAGYQNQNTEAGELVREASLPNAVLSKKALGMGVGIFGLFTMAGVAAALFVDRRDAMGGGRRSVERLVPDANLRMMPTAVSRTASPAEIDAAIDRLAVELVGGGSRGRATSVLVASTRGEPPVAMAEELAASLTFAGIPALFVLAGSSERELRQAHVIVSFADLIAGPSLTGPASLPDVAGASSSDAAPTVTWLRPRGSAESSGLLRRAVVEALISRAGREGFEAVVFVASTPTRNAAAAALGQWVTKTAVIVDDGDVQGVVATVAALCEADVAVTEVVWT